LNKFERNIFENENIDCNKNNNFVNIIILNLKIKILEKKINYLNESKSLKLIN